MYASLDSMATPKHKEKNLKGFIETNTFPKFSTRFKTIYMKEYKKQMPYTNVCYNPNLRVRTHPDFSMNTVTTNNV